MEVRTARFSDLDPATLYELLRLRVDVFVVEQACPYPELDGRDIEPATRHCWVADEGQMLAYLRIVEEPDGRERIGRVATRPSARGRGLAAALMRHALGTTARPLVLDAQSRLVDWYAGFGFEVNGEEFIEDGIPHIPMRLP
jgi:ElaA protein